METITYLDMTTYSNRTIDVRTADISDIDAAYTSLLAQSDCGGAFPGSKRWLAVKTYRDQLQVLVASRPEIERYRTQRINGQAVANSGNVWSN